MAESPRSSAPRTRSSSKRALELAAKKAESSGISTRRERAAARDADQGSAKGKEQAAPTPTQATASKEVPAPQDGGAESSDHEADMAAQQGRRRRTKRRGTRRRYGAAKRRRSAPLKVQANEDATKSDSDDEKNTSLPLELDTEEGTTTQDEEVAEELFSSTCASSITKKVIETNDTADNGKEDGDTKVTPETDAKISEPCTNGAPPPTEGAEVKSAQFTLSAATVDSSSADVVRSSIDGENSTATTEVKKADQPEAENRSNVDSSKNSSVEGPAVVVEPVAPVSLNGEEKTHISIGDMSKPPTKQAKKTGSQVDAVMSSGPRTSSPSSSMESDAEMVDFSGEDADNEMSEEGEDVEEDESKESTEAGSAGVAGTSASTTEQQETGNGDNEHAAEESVSQVGNSNNTTITQLLQAAQAAETPGIAMLAEAAEGATPAGHLCQLCNKTYPVASSLQRHMKLAHSNVATSNSGNDAGSVAGPSPLPRCNFCNVVLPSPATQLVRRRHLRHECKSNPYTCDQCTKVFISPGGLQRHSLLHDGKRPFRCGVCDKDFTQASHLKIHMNGHTGHKPYRCDHDQCEKTYSDPSSLRSHKLAHQGIKLKKKRNPDAPYLANPKCAYCDERFVSRAQRDQHARECRHNPYRCMICNKACLGMVKLERHIRSHSRSRVSSLKAQELAKNKKTQSPDPKCAYCDLRFPTRVVRDRHSRMCNKNPYRCSVCSKAFLGTAKLMRHLRSHTEGGTERGEKESSEEDVGDGEQETSLNWSVDGSVTTKQEPQLTDNTGLTDTVTILAPACTAPTLTMSGPSTPVAVSAVSSGTANNSTANTSVTPLVGSTVMTTGVNPGVMMAPGNHPMIAVPTPLGYSFMPATFPSISHPMSMMTMDTSQQGTTTEGIQMGLQPVTVTLPTGDGTDSSSQQTATFLAPVGYPFQPYLQAVPVNSETTQPTQQQQQTQQMPLQPLPTTSAGSSPPEKAFQPVKRSQAEVTNTTPLLADTSIRLVLPMQPAFQTVSATKVEPSSTAQPSQTQQTQVQASQIQQIVQLQPQQVLQLQTQPVMQVPVQTSQQLQTVQSAQVQTQQLPSSTASQQVQTVQQLQPVQTSTQVQLVQGVQQVQSVEPAQQVQTSQAMQIVQPAPSGQQLQPSQAAQQVQPVQVSQQLPSVQLAAQAGQAVPVQQVQAVESSQQNQPLQVVQQQPLLQTSTQAVPPTMINQSIVTSGQPAMLQVAAQPMMQVVDQQQQLLQVQTSISQPSVVELPSSESVLQMNDEMQLAVFQVNQPLQHTVLPAAQLQDAQQLQGLPQTTVEVNEHSVPQVQVQQPMLPVPNHQSEQIVPASAMGQLGDQAILQAPVSQDELAAGVTIKSEPLIQQQAAVEMPNQQVTNISASQLTVLPDQPQQLTTSTSDLVQAQPVVCASEQPQQTLSMPDQPQQSL